MPIYFMALHLANFGGDLRKSLKYGGVGPQNRAKTVLLRLKMLNLGWGGPFEKMDMLSGVGLGK